MFSYDLSACEDVGVNGPQCVSLGATQKLGSIIPRVYGKV